jgi:hypothetical protein
VRFGASSTNALRRLSTSPDAQAFKRVYDGIDPWREACKAGVGKAPECRVFSGLSPAQD